MWHGRDLATDCTSNQQEGRIVFIDELGAIGETRGALTVGGHDEREQTLNQLLVEMDGFDPRVGVVILAATNRPETLDPALLRAGRFDRQVLVDRPDVNGREAILKIHVQKVKVAEGVDLKVIAQKTPCFSGADLANIINEAALLAARKSKSAVEMEDLDEAVDRIIAGLEKKNRVINPKEKEIVAYHETGHALVGKEYSEATAARLDNEVKELITERAGGVREFFTNNRVLLESVAAELSKAEVMESNAFYRLVDAQ
jgi:ATP-dependent Zn protease